MNKKIYLILIIFAIILAGIVGYLFIRTPKIQNVFVPTDKEAQNSDLSKATLFVRNYLDAYSRLKDKGNFDEVKSYISEKEKKRMIDENTPLETNFTHFDRFEIIEISKSEDELLGKYVAKVKLYKNNVILQNPSGEIMKVYIIEENGKLKTPSWYFTQ